MATLTLRIAPAPNPGGWSLTWHVDGHVVGEPIPVAAADAHALAAILPQFERPHGRTGGGLAPRPILAAAALAARGRLLFDHCCGPTWDAVRGQLNGTTRRLLIQSPLADALNLPWELLPLGHGDGPVGCDPAWEVYRTPLEPLLPADDTPLPAGPLRILFLAAAPADRQALDYEKEEEAILNATPVSPSSAPACSPRCWTARTSRTRRSCCRNSTVPFSPAGCSTAVAGPSTEQATRRQDRGIPHVLHHDSACFRYGRAI